MSTPKIIFDETLGCKIVVIPEIIFKNKQNINWDDVEAYLKKYVNEVVEISSTKDSVYIGKDFPNEFAGSKYTRDSKGMRAKVKANSSQGILEMLSIATEKVFRENHKSKHKTYAKNGWYYYKTRFALPIYNNNNEISTYNIYAARLVVNCTAGGKLYLYDLVDIKREASNPLKTI